MAMMLLHVRKQVANYANDSLYIRTGQKLFCGALSTEMNYTLTLKPPDLCGMVTEVSSLPMRERVHAFEALLLKMPQLEIVPRHYFAHGCYAREITIPAGAIVTGKIHKFAQINILSKGEISVLTENGIERVSAPFTIVSPPGTKRVAQAHTECVWTTILGTHETDADKIEAYFTTSTEQEYLAHVAQLQIGASIP